MALVFMQTRSAILTQRHLAGAHTGHGLSATILAAETMTGLIIAGQHGGPLDPLSTATARAHARWANSLGHHTLLVW